jgi:hypothetical protein
METYIRKRKREVRLIEQEYEVLQWIDGIAPLPHLKGTSNGMYVKHSRAIKRLIEKGIIEAIELGKGQRRYKRVIQANH